MAKTNNIMVVDDEANIRNLLYGVLTEQGFQVSLARDGQDAWNKMRSRHFALLITDIDMPRLDGIKLLQKMKKNKRREKVLVMTGRCMQDGDLDFEFPKVYGLLRKPFRISVFIKTVASILLSQGPAKKQTLLRANTVA
jgi:DNA-binding NtrC family response regulator